MSVLGLKTRSPGAQARSHSITIRSPLAGAEGVHAMSLVSYRSADACAPTMCLVLKTLQALGTVLVLGAHHLMGDDKVGGQMEA